MDLTAPRDSADCIPVKKFTISRVPLQPGYDVLENGELKFHAEMDFVQRFKQNWYKLTLRNLDEKPADIAVCYMPVCYMPWSSQEIQIGFQTSRRPQDVRWETMKKTKQPWQDLAREDYHWTALSRGRKTAHLVWTSRLTWPINRRSYILLGDKDQNTKDILAEFHSDKRLHMGGTLIIHRACDLLLEDGDPRYPKEYYLKILMAFLAVYETSRRRCHHTVYRPSKGNSKNKICYRALQLLQKLKTPIS